MEALAPVAFVVVFAAIIGLVVWLIVRTSRHNRAPRKPATSAGLAELAAAKGWQYSPRADGFLQRYSNAYPFGHGARKRPALDLLTGAHRGREFVCFQFSPPRALMPGEHSAEIDYLRVVALSLPTPVPHMQLNTHRLPQWARKYTVGDEAFDKTFVVGTEDERFTNRVLTVPVRHWLMENPPVGDLRFDGTELMGWQPDRGDFDAGSVEPALNRLCDLLDRIPPDALRT